MKTNGIPASECSVTTSAAHDGSTVDMATGKQFAANELYLKTPAGQDGDLVTNPFVITSYSIHYTKLYECLAGSEEYADSSVRLLPKY